MCQNNVFSSCLGLRIKAKMYETFEQIEVCCSSVRMLLMRIRKPINFSLSPIFQLRNSTLQLAIYMQRFLNTKRLSA